MNIELIPATAEDVPVLRRLMQFYLYDIAALDGWDLNEDGTYGNAVRIETFWAGDDYERFLIRVEGVIAGFVFASRSEGEGGEEVRVISEFFVLRRYRRAGVGRTVATRLFAGFDGMWKLSIMRANGPAVEFWGSVIAGVTGQELQEFTASTDADEDLVFRFRTGG